MSKTDKEKSIPAMSIKSLGGTPPEFDMSVTVPRLDGSRVELKLRARGMRRSEWAAMRDEHMKEVSGDKASGDAEEFSFVRLVAERSAEAASLVCKGVVGWQLEDAFTPENLLAADDVLPGTINAVLTAYDAALFHGRLGN